MFTIIPVFGSFQPVESFRNSWSLQSILKPFKLLSSSFSINFDFDIRNPKLQFPKLRNVSYSIAIFHWWFFQLPSKKYNFSPTSSKFTKMLSNHDSLSRFSIRRKNYQAPLNIRNSPPGLWAQPRGKRREREEARGGGKKVTNNRLPNGVGARRGGRSTDTGSVDKRVMRG